MLTEQTKKAWYAALTAGLEKSFNRQRLPKIHDFSQRSLADFAFERIAGENQAYMTGQGRGVSRGDYILLQLDQSPESYQIQMVDYYTSPSDLWIALLAEAELPR